MPETHETLPQPEKPKGRVIDSLWTFIVAVLVVGPFALPLLWRNPRYKSSTKVVGSIVVIVFTLWLFFVAGKFLQNLNIQLQDQLRQMEQLGR